MNGDQRMAVEKRRRQRLRPCVRHAVDRYTSTTPCRQVYIHTRSGMTIMTCIKRAVSLITSVPDE